MTAGCDLEPVTLSLPPSSAAPKQRVEQRRHMDLHQRYKSDGLHANASRRGCEEEHLHADGEARACAARTDPSQASSKARMTSRQLKWPNNLVDRNRACPARNRACTTGDTLRAVFLIALLVAQTEASPPRTPHQIPPSSEPSRDVPCSRRALAASG